MVLSSMGCDTETNVPGTFDSMAFLKISERSSKSCAVFHSLMGLRRTMMSVLSLPTGSMATSARPVMASVVTTSGKPCSTFSDSMSSRRASSSEMLGARRMVTTASPSKMRGTNSAPDPAKSQPTPTSEAAAAPMSRTRCFTAQGTMVAYFAPIHSIHRGPWPDAGGTSTTSTAGKKSTE
ncbi:MAG: hypothetical protein QM820_41145 [Minicystis sp.]